MLDLNQLAARREDCKGVTGARSIDVGQGRATSRIPVSAAVCVGHEEREDAECPTP